MSATLLGNLHLTYELVWDRQRHPRGLHLSLDAADHSTAIDGAHLLNLLAETWNEQAPQLIVSARSDELLLSFVAHARASDPWVVVPQARLEANPALRALVPAAAARGARLLWQAGAAQAPAPPAELAASFAHRLLRAESAAGAPPQTLFEQVATQAEATRHLDAEAAWGILGWPVDDTLAAAARGPQPVRPDPDAVQSLIAAVDRDMSTERLEDAIDEQPELVFRLLAHLNSAALGLRNPPETLRHGLMLLGMQSLRQWLETQRSAPAAEDAGLRPVRTALVVYAQLASTLVDAGEELALRREVYLCALLSRMAPLLREPLPSLMRQIPVSERMRAALARRDGPYAPFLALAEALGHAADPGRVAALCEEHELELEDVNRTTLRVLAQLQSATGRFR